MISPRHSNLCVLFLQVSAGGPIYVKYFINKTVGPESKFYESLFPMKLCKWKPFSMIL